MLNKLNYFNKLICVFLISLCVVFSKNAYINIVLIILPFAFSIFISNFKLSILCGISFFIYLFTCDYATFLWIYKIWQIFIYYSCLKVSFTEREKVIFINRLFYRIRSIRKIFSNIFYENIYKKNKNLLKGKIGVRNELKKKTKNEINNKVLIARTRYYGISKKRREYGINTWSRLDSTVLCITMLFVIASILF